LAALAADLPFTGGSGKGSVRRAAAVLALFSGALAGALLLRTSLWLPLAAAAGLGLATSSWPSQACIETAGILGR
jgi:hypothetical protein